MISVATVINVHHVIIDIKNSGYVLKIMVLKSCGFF